MDPSDLNDFWQRAMGPWLILPVLVITLGVASFGTITTVVSRKTITLVVILFALVMTFLYHEHLPLPREVHSQFRAIERRLF